jgi:putative transposase
MKTSRYSDSQIIAILKQADAGTSGPELCREHGMSSASFYKYGSMDASMVARLKELEDENRRLKKMYAEERLKSEIIQEAMTKIPKERGTLSGKAVASKRDGPAGCLK